MENKQENRYKFHSFSVVPGDIQAQTSKMSLIAISPKAGIWVHHKYIKNGLKGKLIVSFAEEWDYTASIFKTGEKMTVSGLDIKKVVKVIGTDIQLSLFGNTKALQEELESKTSEEKPSEDKTSETNTTNENWNIKI